MRRDPGTPEEKRLILPVESVFAKEVNRSICDPRVVMVFNRNPTGLWLKVQEIPEAFGKSGFDSLASHIADVVVINPVGYALFHCEQIT